MINRSPRWCPASWHSSTAFTSPFHRRLSHPTTYTITSEYRNNITVKIIMHKCHTTWRTIWDETIWVLCHSFHLCLFVFVVLIPLDGSLTQISQQCNASNGGILIGVFPVGLSLFQYPYQHPEPCWPSTSSSTSSSTSWHTPKIPTEQIPIGIRSVGKYSGYHHHHHHHHLQTSERVNAVIILINPHFLWWWWRVGRVDRSLLS